jgi:uncharacterized membrane protein
MLLIYAIVQLIIFLIAADRQVRIGLIIFNVFFVIYCIIVLSGVVKGKRAISKENKYLKKINPYIYFRELPNFFGIGVTTLLMDSTIENYKDIVAVILDLCAKKYLNLEKQGDKYIIKVLKGIDDSLLSNEKYILSLVLNNDVKNISYKEWFNYCMQDGMNLGLYTHTIKKNKIDKPFLSRQERIKKDRKIKLIMSLILPCLVFLLTFSSNIILAIFSSIVLFGISYFYLTMVFNIKFFFSEMFREAKYYKSQNYIDQMNNNLTRTDKGIKELHKLYSFKAFIKDFGHFVDKKPEEVALWDRYLSYAQVFGLTKEIMESGHKELINNSSFQIDNIDNITLHNIEVK